MPQPQAAPLELRHGPLGAGAAEIAGPRQILEILLRLQHRQHVLGIALPIGGEMEHPPRLEPRRHQAGEVRLHQAALVVALLRPWVGEPEEDSVQAPGRHVLAQYVNGVTAQQAHVGELLLGDGRQQASDAGVEDVYTKEVPLRMGPGQARQRLAVAEADLHHPGGPASENGVEVQHAPGFDPIGRPAALDGGSLGPGQAGRAPYEAAHRAVAGHASHQPGPPPGPGRVRTLTCETLPITGKLINSLKQTC